MRAVRGVQIGGRLDSEKCPLRDGARPLSRDDFKVCVACEHKCETVEREFTLAFRAKPLEGDGTE